MKKTITILTLATLVLVACGEQERPEDIYNRSKGNIAEATESVYFTRSQQLAVDDEAISTFTRGAAHYHTARAYLETSMNLIDFNDALDVRFYVEDGEVSVIEDETQRTLPEENIEDLMQVVDPVREMDFFAPVEEEMLMKEENGFYEISFRGDDERHLPLIQTKMEQWDISGGEEIDEATMDTVDIDRIDMTAWVDMETYQLYGIDTRFRFYVEVGGDLQQIDEQQSVQYSYHNEVPDELEPFVHEVLAEQIREQEEAEEEENEEE